MSLGKDPSFQGEDRFFQTIWTLFFFSPQPCSKRGEPGAVHKLAKHQSSN